MASTFNTAGNVSTTNAASSSTQSITATTGSNDILVVAIRNNTNNNAVTTADYGGVSGTILSSATYTTPSMWVGLIIFLAPPTGTQTLTLNHAGTESYVGSYAFYSNEKQTGQPSTTNYLNNSTAATDSQSITPSPAGMAITATASADASTLNSGATSRNNFSGSIIADSNGDVSSQQTVSVSLGTRSHSVWQIALTPIATANPAFLLNFV